MNSKGIPSMKRSLLPLVMLMLAMQGCMNQNIIEENDPAQIDEGNVKEQIEIWHTYSDEETRIFEKEVIPLFEEEFPDIDVKPVRQPHNEQLMSALISRASVNRTPDIIRMDITWLPKFADLKLLYPVSEFEDFDEVKERFYRPPLESNRYGEDYYGLPLNTNTKAAIFNKDTVEDLGLDQLPHTMDELLDVVEENQLTIGINDVSPWNSLPYFYGLGGKLLSPQYTQAAGYLDSKESIAAVERLVQLYENGNFPAEILKGYPQTWEKIRTGGYFMIDEGPWFYSVHSLLDIEVLKRQTVSAPFPSNEVYTSVLGGENAVITKGSQHREASWTFIKWLTTETPQKLLLTAGVLPTNTEVEMSSIVEQYPYYESYIESIDKTFLRPPVPQWNEINSIYTEYFRLMFSGELSAEEGLKKAAEEIDELLIHREDEEE
ncbi:extracellular solute-binding protein [Rossellomorea vietnamensis]|uniref:extracellular solute-binding protein n=1 Tax=Rossellomorea vietnamensis TaxID=218284 RepID=UPI003CE6B94B